MRKDLFVCLEEIEIESFFQGNFRGRRYKCLICYDYDLCSTCHESGAATTQHSASHAMQCILTRADHDLFYGGESGELHPQVKNFYIIASDILCFSSKIPLIPIDHS